MNLILHHHQIDDWQSGNHNCQVAKDSSSDDDEGNGGATTSCIHPNGILPSKIKDYYVELCNIRDGKQGVIPRQQPILPNLPDDYKDYVNKSKKTKKK